MSFSFSDFAAALKAGAAIAPADVLALRQTVWPDGKIAEGEAAMLFELNRAAGAAAPEWDAFFVETLTELVVNGKAPRGYVDEANAAWLIEQIDRDGAPVTELELALVVKVVERALNCPAALRDWALRQIEERVLRGSKHVDADEAHMLRRLVFAPGGEGALGVGQAEAELLWRLKDACRDAGNAPEWKTLFVQGVGNHLMAHNSYVPLAREEAARLDAFVDDHRGNVLGFLARMRGANPLREARGLLGKADDPSHDAQVAAARAVTEAERAWLDGHVDADGAVDAYEDALLAFIAQESEREG